VGETVPKQPSSEDAPTSTEPNISVRATSIVRGLIKTERAAGIMSLEYGMLQLKCRSGGYYWITLDGGQVRRGKTLFKADELQPKFIDAMERAGR
jgi:hypothetical protein